MKTITKTVYKCECCDMEYDLAVFVKSCDRCGRDMCSECQPAGELDQSEANLCLECLKSDGLLVLGQIIKRLADEKNKNPERILPFGFTHPHSYRGVYKYLGVSLSQNCRVDELHRMFELCLFRAFRGWKGGEYRMDSETPVFVAEEGSIKGAVPITRNLLDSVLDGTLDGSYFW